MSGPQVAGAEIVTVDEDSPAAQAGLRVGDVVLELDGQPVRDATALTTALAQRQPGDRVTLTVMRDRDRRSVSVVLGEFPRGETAQALAGGQGRPERVLGFSVRPLTPQLAQELGVSERSGVVVSEVVPYGPAANAGLREGQVVLSLNGQPVRTAADLDQIVDALGASAAVSVRVRDREVGETIVNFRARR